MKTLVSKVMSVLRGSRRKVVLTRLREEYADYDIGDWTYGQPKVLRYGATQTLTIGRYCSIADEVTIFLGGEHNTDWVTTYPFNEMMKEASEFVGHPKSRGDVVIGNDVWIGRGATLLSGVHIGDGAVIGACSLVSRNVEAYSVVGGVPAVQIRSRFSCSTVEKLLAIRWWDWPEARVKAALPLLLSNQIDEFIQFSVRQDSNLGQQSAK